MGQEGEREEIKDMAERRFSEDGPVMVSIRCITYNHAPYIRQCLEGFVMQKTNFRFQAVVHDDASTDGTTEIVREYAEKYPDIIVPMYEEENRWSKHDGSLLTVMLPHFTGKYFCECEGDDYWIDPYKLQKQVDFLENHPDHGMIYTAFRPYNQIQKKFLEEGGCCQSNFEKMLICNKISTPTTMIRTSWYLKYLNKILPTAIKRQWKMSDYPLWLYIMAQTKAKYIPDVTSVYRILENSASNFTSFDRQREFVESTYDIRLFFAKKYEISPNLQRKIAKMEIESLIWVATLYDTNLRFHLLSHLITNNIFTPKRYLSSKLRFYRLGRNIYKRLKEIGTILKAK